MKFSAGDFSLDDVPGFCRPAELDSDQIETLPYFAMYNSHFLAQISEGKIRMCILQGYYLEYFTPILVFCNYLLY